MQWYRVDIDIKTRQPRTYEIDLMADSPYLAAMRARLTIWAALKRVSLPKVKVTSLHLLCPVCKGTGPMCCTACEDAPLLEKLEVPDLSKLD